LRASIGHQRGTLHGLAASEGALAQALGSDIKGKISPLLYFAAIVLAFFSPWLSIAIYVLVAVLWLVPDRRIAQD